MLKLKKYDYKPRRKAYKVWSDDVDHTPTGMLKCIFCGSNFKPDLMNPSTVCSRFCKLMEDKDDSKSERSTQCGWCDCLNAKPAQKLGKLRHPTGLGGEFSNWPERYAIISRFDVEGNRPPKAFEVGYDYRYCKSPAILVETVRHIQSWCD